MMRATKRAALALLWLLLAGRVACAGLTGEELARVSVDPPAGAKLDLKLGRPTVLLFADFDCGQLCEAVLAQTAETLAATGLSPRSDYALVVVGIDPRDGEAAATGFVHGQLPQDMLGSITALRPDARRLAEMATALGYGYAFDAENDRFAHPAVLYVLTARGEVSRVLPALQTTPDEMRAALAAAGETGAATLGDRLLMLCYGFDPVTGRYSLQIERVLMVLSAATLLIVAACLALAFCRERKEGAR